MNAELQVLVVDDHPTVREGLVRILTEAQPGWRVQQAGSGADALLLVAQHRFDVGIVDMSMPGMNGIELLTTIRAQGHRMPLLMLSMHAEEAYALRAFKAGATGYITKDQAGDRLIEAVHTVAAGGLFATPLLARQLRMNDQGLVERLPHASLSERELQVLRQVAAGATATEAAAALQLPEAAVLGAKQRVLEKLRLSSVQQLVAYAQTHRL